jgi:hypothetical protein
MHARNLYRVRAGTEPQLGEQQHDRTVRQGSDFSADRLCCPVIHEGRGLTMTLPPASGFVVHVRQKNGTDDHCWPSSRQIRKNPTRAPVGKCALMTEGSDPKRICDIESPGHSLISVFHVTGWPVTVAVSPSRNVESAARFCGP